MTPVNDAIHKCVGREITFYITEDPLGQNIALYIRAMRNSYFTLLRLTWDSGLPEFRMTEIYRKKTGLPETRNYTLL